MNKEQLIRAKNKEWDKWLAENHESLKEHALAKYGTIEGLNEAITDVWGEDIREITTGRRSKIEWETEIRSITLTKEQLGWET